MRNNEMETRNLPGVVEFRASDNGVGKLEGYAAVYNRLSQNLGGFVEQVHPDAFRKSLADNVPVVARLNHQDSGLLGTTESGTVRLSSDGTGLRYSVDLPDTSVGRDVAVLAKRGDLRYSSFAFRTISDEWGTTPDDFPLRTLTGAQLIDVAPVVTPAYRDTSTGLRMLAERINRPFEEVMEAAKAGELRSLLGEPQNDDTDVQENRSGQSETHPDFTVYRHKLLLWSLP